MNPDFNKEEVIGEDGSQFEAYITEYTHTVDDGYGETYQTNVQMMVNPETGASIVGNPTEGFFLYVPDEYGTVHQFVVDQSSGADATIASTQDIRNLSYLINSDFLESSKTLGAFGTKPVSAYGPNGELNPFTTAPGEMKTAIIGGKEVQIAVSNPENMYNYTSDFDFSNNHQLSDAPSEQADSTTGQDTTVSGESGGTSSSYSSMYSAEDYFQKGLNGQAEDYFPWLRTDMADGFRDKFIYEGSFSGMMSYDQFRACIDETIAEANAGISIIMSENRTGKKAERVLQLREAQNLTQEFQTLKESMDSSIFRNAIVTYNDSVEQAKVEKTRKVLREACKNYNNTNTNVVRSYTTTDYDAVRSESERCRSYRMGTDADGVTTYRVEIYDKIDYDGAWDGIDFGWGLFNMKTDRMVQELQARGIHINLEDRPDWTR